MLGRRSGAALFVMVMVLVAGLARPTPALAASAAEINRDADAAVARLVAEVPSARELARKAKAVLVFPRIYKAGFMFGAQYGEGALRRQGKTVGYYNTVAASYGFQAGAQSFGYALLFMNDAALAQLNKTEGFELGVGPSIVVLDAGKAKAITTATVHEDIYAFIFGQKGLMAGMGLQGSKISKIAR
jgi:lipid-binding SYLF domain-containing protein